MGYTLERVPVGWRAFGLCRIFGTFSIRLRHRVVRDPGTIFCERCVKTKKRWESPLPG